MSPSAPHIHPQRDDPDQPARNRSGANRPSRAAGREQTAGRAQADNRVKAAIRKQATDREQAAVRKHTAGQAQADNRVKAAIREQAAALGFDALGIARAETLESHQPLLSAYLEKGHHGKMGYMARHIDKRLDPRLLLKGARSVIVAAYNYYPAMGQAKGTSYRIARYAYGQDYHRVIKDKLHKLAQAVEEIAGKHTCRVFTDSAPVLEKAWAERAGLGKTGKNTCFIIPRKGSYLFLGEIITTMDLAPDEAFEKDLCGHCRRCMDACPTQAITDAGQLDARRCLSYLTIELKDRIPDEFRAKSRGWVFGCDICQEVCPHNRFAAPSNEKAFRPITAVAEWTDKEWEEMDRERFNQHIRKAGSPMGRITYDKMMDNIRCATEVRR